MVIPGGGLNSTVAGLGNHPFSPMEEFKGEYRVIAADLRNAISAALTALGLSVIGGQSSGPIESDRPWDAYADDHIGLMDHLGIREFMVLGFCIGGPFIWNLLKRAGDPSSRPCRRSPVATVRRCPASPTTTTSRAGARSCAPAGPTSRWRWSIPF